MNTSIKIAFAAVVTLMVTLLGLNLVPRSGGVGAELPTPSPTASPSPVPTLPPSGELAPGTYRADYLTYTVPAGWSSSEGWATYKDPTEGALLVSPWGPFLTVYSDPCHWQSTGAAVGPTVDDEVAALVAQHRGATVTPIDVTVDGFSGKELDLVVPLDVTIAMLRRRHVQDMDRRRRRRPIQPGPRPARPARHPRRRRHDRRHRPGLLAGHDCC